MEPLVQHPDGAHAVHLEEVRRVLALPSTASGLHWHPFGLYTAPLANREVDGVRWARRLHIWHPEAKPVGESSPYGVHSHTGDAASHVVLGALHHHLYTFEDDPDGVWVEDPSGARRGLTGHIQGTTEAGITHRFPAHHAHGVTKPPGFAVSLFEQVLQAKEKPFTTWQRTDIPIEELVRVGPVPVEQVRLEALARVEQALFEADVSA